MADRSSLSLLLLGGLLAMGVPVESAWAIEDSGESGLDDSEIGPTADDGTPESDPEKHHITAEEKKSKSEMVEGEEQAPLPTTPSDAEARPEILQQSPGETAATKPLTRLKSSETMPPNSEASSAVEEDEGWLQWPIDKSTTPLRKDFPSSRWASVGAFVGSVHRPSKSREVVYKRGVAYGGYVRPEITSWLAVRLFYRQESIPVALKAGAYDYGGTSTGLLFEQDNLEVINVGLRVEPMWVIHPKLRVHGILGWSWLGFRAPIPTASGFNEKVPGMKPVRGTRSGVETNITFGGGVTVDLIRNWLELGLSASYSIAASQTGAAYDPPLQVVVDGEITYLAPLPKLGNSTDILFNLGFIL